MQLQRSEFLTGALVLITVAVLTAILILLGAPGLFRPLVTYKIYFDNAAGIKLGAPVLLAGRKIGQVEFGHGIPPSLIEQVLTQNSTPHGR